MKTNAEIIKKAIECVQGREVAPGTIVAHESNERAMSFIRYEGDNAICHDEVMGEVSYPKDEIFDANLMNSVAHDILAQELTKESSDGESGTFVVRV